MALLKLSRTDIAKWLHSQPGKKDKPLQDMTPSEIDQALATFKIPKPTLMQLIRGTEWVMVPAPTLAECRRLDGGMNQTPNPQVENDALWG